MTKKILALSLALCSCFLGGGIAAAKQTDVNSPKITGTAPSVLAVTTKTVDITCVKTAVEKREDAIKATYDKLSASIDLALTTRKSDLSNAWTLTDKTQRNTAIKTAWANFTKAKKAATKEYRTEQAASWTQFSKDRKACGASTTGEDPANDVSISN